MRWNRRPFLSLKPISSKLLDDGELKSFAPLLAPNAATRQSALTAVAAANGRGGTGIRLRLGYGIEALCHNGAMRWYFGHERLHEWPLTAVASTYRRAIDPPIGVLEAPRLLLEALQWNRGKRSVLAVLD